MIVLQSQLTDVAELPFFNQRSTMGIPSPGGEGWGEGELNPRKHSERNFQNPGPLCLCDSVAKNPCFTSTEVYWTLSASIQARLGYVSLSQAMSGEKLNFLCLPRGSVFYSRFPKPAQDYPRLPKPAQAIPPGGRGPARLNPNQPSHTKILAKSRPKPAKNLSTRPFAGFLA
jgi:hypothetical protein